ncbi:hypothetical protein V6N13_018238 [Hibiscus sabdariffa]
MIKSFDGNKGRWSFVGSNNKVPEHCSDQGTRIEALRNAHKRKVKHSSGLISLVSKEILEIKALNQNDGCFAEEGKIKNAVPSKSREGSATMHREQVTCRRRMLRTSAGDGGTS